MLCVVSAVAFAGVYASGDFLDGKSSSENDGYPLYPPFDRVPPEYEIIVVTPPDATTARPGLGSKNEQTTKATWGDATETTTRWGAVTPVPQINESPTWKTNKDGKYINLVSSDKNNYNPRTATTRPLFESSTTNQWPKRRSQGNGSRTRPNHNKTQEWGAGPQGPVVLIPQMDPQENTDEFDLRFSKVNNCNFSDKKLKFPIRRLSSDKTSKSKTSFCLQSRCEFCWPFWVKPR